VKILIKTAFYSLFDGLNRKKTIKIMCKIEVNAINKAKSKIVVLP
jgi:hypothetical protein